MATKPKPTNTSYGSQFDETGFNAVRADVRRIIELFPDSDDAPLAHASSHEDGGSDEVTLENLPTNADEGEIFVGTASGTIEPKHFYVVEPSDDLESILNAVADNTEIILNEGTHVVSSQVTFSGLSNVTVRGTPASIVSITYDSGAPFVLDAPLTDIRFSGFDVDFIAATSSYPLFSLTGSSGTLTNLSFMNIDCSMDGGGARHRFIRASNPACDISGLRMVDCTFEGSLVHDIVRFDTANGQFVENIFVKGCQRDRDTLGGSVVFGFFPADGGTVRNVTITDNQIRNAKEVLGTNLGGASAVIKNITYSRNKIVDSGGGGQWGAYCYGSNYVVCENTFEGYTGNHCIRAGFSHGLIAGNIINGSSGDGIWIQSCDNVVIANNDVTGCGDDGIYEGSGSDSNVFVGNYSYGNTDDYDLSGTNRVRLDRDGSRWAPEALYVEDLVTDGNSGYVATSDGNGDVYMGDVAVNFDRIVTDEAGFVVVEDDTGNVVYAS